MRKTYDVEGVRANLSMILNLGETWRVATNERRGSTIEEIVSESA